MMMMSGVDLLLPQERRICPLPHWVQQQRRGLLLPRPPLRLRQQR
jgi:hypothetical protein